jgi:hypothetical protein
VDSEQHPDVTRLGDVDGARVLHGRPAKELRFCVIFRASCRQRRETLGHGGAAAVAGHARTIRFHARLIPATGHAELRAFGNRRADSARTLPKRYRQYWPLSTIQPPEGSRMTCNDTSDAVNVASLGVCGLPATLVAG